MGIRYCGRTDCADARSRGAKPKQAFAHGGGMEGQDMRAFIGMKNA